MGIKNELSIEELKINSSYLYSSELMQFPNAKYIAKVLLKYPKYTVLEVRGESTGSFGNPLSYVISVYNWDVKKTSHFWEV